MVLWADRIDRLLRRLTAGDETALGPLFDFYRPRLHQELAVELATDPRLGARFDAADVVQEVFLDARRQIGWFVARGGRVDFWVWLRGLARERRLKFLREHLDAQRRTAKRQQALPDDSADHPAAPTETPSDAVMLGEESERLMRALSLMTPEDRDVIRLRVTEGRSNAEAGALLGLTPGAVAKRLERALRRLRQVAGDEPGS
jgi:RNA polymerase sigma-70 factor (ECF subfamily)